MNVERPGLAALMLSWPVNPLLNSAVRRSPEECQDENGESDEEFFLNRQQLLERKILNDAQSSFKVFQLMCDALFSCFF